MQSIGRGGSFIWWSLTAALLFPTVVHANSWSNTITLREPENRFSLNKSTEIGQNIWNISVQNGHVIMLAFEKIDIGCYAANEIPIACDCTKLEVYDGYNKLYSSCASSVYPTLLTSSSNKLDVVFSGKQTKENHLYFTAVYKAVNASSVNKSCGNDVIGMEGSIVSPGFPNNYTNLLICDWTLSVSNPNLLIQLEIQSGDIESSTQCTFDSLEIYDGSTLSSTRFDRYCGAFTVKLTASSRYLHMRFISNWNATGRGFQAQWTAGYNTVNMTDPEKRFNLTKSGVIGMNIWNITVESGFVVQLAFDQLDLQCYAHSYYYGCDCARLEVFDGEQPLFSSCASSVYPTLLMSSSNKLDVVFSGKQTKENHLYFTAVYKAVNASSVNKSCGNDVIGMEGSIVSPGFPNNYTNLLICDWTLSVSNPNLLIQLEIQSGDIESSTQCTFDSLEIYDGSTLSSTRIGRYCGAFTVKLTASSRYLRMRFISNWNATGRGFQAQWTAGYNNVNMTDPEKRFNLTKSGVIGMNIWNITVESGFVVQLAFDQLNLYCYANSYYYGCDCARLEVFDGEQPLFSLCSSTSSLVNSLPSLLTSTGNRVGIVFSGKQSVDNMLYFTAIYKSVNSTHVNHSCGKLENGTEGTIVSPGFPNNYTDVLVCEWTITSLSYVQLVIESYDLEYSTNCIYDSLQVYNGNSASSSRLGRFCGKSVEADYIHLLSSRFMFVRMISNWNSTGRGFIAYWRTVYCQERSRDLKRESSVIPQCHAIVYCNERTRVLMMDTYFHFAKPESRVFYPGFCFNGMCIWNITSDDTKAVQLNLKSYNVKCERNYLENPCQCSMLQVYDGSYIDNGSLILSLCYNYGYFPDLVSSTTNNLILVLRNYYPSFAMQFEASYKSINTSDVCRSFSYNENETLTSPYYPLDYPNATDCTYNILLTNPGYQLVFNFTDFQVQDSQTVGYCRNDFVRINNVQYCGSERPDTIVTNSSTSVTFHSDISTTQSGFQLTYRAHMFECGESLMMTPTGTINSPGYPLAYPNHVNCTWTILANSEQVIHLVFNAMNIGDVNGFFEGDSCTYRAAYLQIFEGSASGNKTLIGSYCGSEIPGPIISHTRNLTVQFVSLYNYPAKYGFSTSYVTLEKSSVFQACGGMLSGGIGTFTSPGHPLAFPNNTVCEWIIMGMPDYPIRISFSDFNMDACTRDSLEFRNGPNTQSNRLSRLCGNSVSQTLTSSPSVMYIKFYGTSRSAFRGFNATWTSVCDQTYGRTSSSLTIQFPSRPGNHSGSIRCTYIVEPYYQEGQIALLTFSNFVLGNDSTDCHHTYIEVRDGGFEMAPLVGRYCGRSSPPTVMLRQSAVWIRFVKNGTEPDTAFTVTVQRQTACGPQTLNGRMGNLTSPFYPNNYPLGLSCTWVIRPETNYTVQLTIDDFLLEGPSGFCPYDWVKVYDGSDLIDTYCYNSYDRIITSQTPGNPMRIEFKSDSSRTFPGFSLSYVTKDPLADYNTRQYELFPFGLEIGDKQIEKTDAHAEKVYIQTGFPVASSLQYEAFVGNKGLVTFKVKDSGKDFRLKEDRMMVCPYHSDISANNTNGGVYYHLHTENKTVLDKASAEVLEFTNIKDYKASLVLLVTWDRVAHIRSTLPERQRATVQLALISNGRQSFALITYRYGAMNWAQLQGEPLVIGVANGNPLEVHKSIYSDSSEAFTSMGKIIGNTGRVGMWIYELGNSYSADQECKDWYKSNLPHDQLRQERFQHLPQCPCSKRFLRGNMVWSQDRDDHNVECYRLNFGTSHLVEPHGMECCYMTEWSDPQTAGQFIADGIHAGSATAYNPEIQIAEYRREDRDAHNVCCYNTTSHEYCDMYYTLRPVRECTTSLPFGFSNLWGDPHIKTLDGYQYTFNGLGEYTLILLNSSSVNFTLQGRTGLAETENGTLTNATVFKAFGADENGVRVFVELDPNTNNTLIIYADGKDYTMQFYGKFNDIVDDNKKFLLKNTNNSLLVGFMSGIEMTIKITLRSLEIAISTPLAFKNRTRGLLGNFNGVKDDDFVLPNGTTLSPNITERQIFETFGPTWSVTKTTSIMMYGQREGPDNYTYPDFKPLLLDEQPPVTRKAAEDLCGSSDLACIYDYLATNSATFANASKQTAKSAEDTEKISKNTVPLIRFNSTLRLYAGNVTSFNLNGYDPDPGDILTYFMTGSMPNNVHLNSTTGDVSLKADLSEAFSLSFYAIDRNDMKSPVRQISIIVCSGCSGHGDCDFNRLVSSNISLTVQVAECVCSPAWSGPNCSENYDACSEVPCSAHQSCTDLSPEEQGNKTKGYTCSDCGLGFKLDESDHTRCLDVDECALANNCSKTCVNTPGSYVCRCDFGYRLNEDGTSCDDVNECAEKAYTCEHNCINTEGSFSCSCFDGYTLAQGRCQRLDNRDACQGVQCDHGCLVQSYPNGTAVPKCFCNSGYELDPTDDKKCVDKNECTEGICSQTCRNTEGSFACGCLAGSVLSEDQRTCVPCEHLRYGPDCRLTCNCNGRGVDCDPVKGCVCQTGWTGSNCDVDVDECSGKITPCGRGQHCTNTNGSFLCTCLPGYAKAKGGNSCLDIDECADESIQYPCSQLQVCTNAPGSYNCVCQPGYMLSNNNCSDLDECTTGQTKCQQQCENVLGSYNCHCHYGYRLNADRVTCSKVRDVCAEVESLHCEHGCTLNEGNRGICICNIGYNLAEDHQKCIDIDECATRTAGCSDSCTNIEGGFYCSCPTGMILDNDERTCKDCPSGTYGTNCNQICACGEGASRCDTKTGCICKSGWLGDKCDIDENECDMAVVQAECQNKTAKCFNLPGAYTCICQEGYQENKNGACQDDDECANSPCDHICENTVGSYRCLCHDGFSLNDTTQRCEDINECAKSGTHKCTQQCDNIAGSYRCSCHMIGYALDNDGVTCIAITNCSTKSCPSVNGGCSHEQCFCNSGYQLNTTNNNTCDLIDIDWCASGACQQSCQETENGKSFTCSCYDGYLLNNDKRTCRGCPVGTFGPGCKTNCTCNTHNTASCNTVNGSCICKAGWSGANCSNDIDECVPPTSISCMAHAQCVNTLGSFICPCVSGFLKTQNDTCQDINECALVTTNNCTQHCENTAGSYRCSCNVTGYVLDNDSATCIDVNECLGNHGCHTCFNTPGSYDCQCREGFTLNEFNKTCDETTRLIFDVKIEIKEQVDLSNQTLYNILSEEARTTLLSQFNKSGSGIIDIKILSISLGSLIIETAAVVWKETQQQSASIMSAIFVNVAGSNLTIGSYSGLTSFVVNGMQVTDNSGLCDVYTKFSICGASQECVESLGQPICRNIQSKDNSWILIIILSTAIPLGIISLALVIFACVHCQKKKHKKECDNRDEARNMNIYSMTEDEQDLRSNSTMYSTLNSGRFSIDRPKIGL